MKNLNYPLDFKFKITTLASDFNITDRNGKHIAYVRQKMFKLKEDVVVFRDEDKSAELFRIKADRWLDFNASYSITGADGTNYGKLTRKGMRSIWKSTYKVYDENNQHKYTIREDNAWVKFWDGLVGELPTNRLVYRIFSKSYLQSEKLFRKNTFHTEENAFTAGQKISTG